MHLCIHQCICISCAAKAAPCFLSVVVGPLWAAPMAMPELTIEPMELKKEEEYGMYVRLFKEKEFDALFKEKEFDQHFKKEEVHLSTSSVSRTS